MLLHFKRAPTKRRNRERRMISIQCFIRGYVKRRERERRVKCIKCLKRGARKEGKGKGGGCAVLYHLYVIMHTLLYYYYYQGVNELCKVQ